MQLPFMRWVPEWRQPGTVRADLLAGLTGAVVVLPQAMAFATLAGLPPQYGLYAAMLPCIVAALFGSSRLMVTGPANAISLTTMALIAPLAAVGSPDYVRLVLTLTFLVGAMQLLLGLARVGAVVDKVPHSVIVGFTAGAAVLIVNSQLGTLLASMLLRVPLLRGVYGTLKEIGEAILSDRKENFQRVVLVEYPRPGIYSIGLVTGDAPETFDEGSGKRLRGVFFPTTPNPTTGPLVYCTDEQMIPTTLRVEQAIKMVVSGGVVVPPKRGTEGSLGDAAAPGSPG